MSISDPSTNAYFFDITDSDGNEFEAFFDVNDFDGFSVGDVRYRPAGTLEGWVFLNPAEHPEGGFSSEFDANEINASTAQCDAEVTRVIDGYNAIIGKVFGLQGSGDEPEKGLDRVKWLIKNQMSGNNNNLTI